MRDLIRKKVDLLNEAARAYEQGIDEIMSNKEYDDLYDELKKLEEETGIVFADSPTVNVGFEVLSQLPKERHPGKMLSLDKTKEVSALADFLKDREGLLSWKIDGLTVVLSYENGKLVKAVTRGNGEIGEVVTANARTFKNLPLIIPFRGKLVLRGEAFITYSDFEHINSNIEDDEARYKNPRNLCSGSVRQLNSEITASRRVNFNTFTLVEAENTEIKTRSQQLSWLEEQGFTCVERKLTDRNSIEEDVNWFKERISEYDIPSDGLVLCFDDIEYGRSLGTTSKFPRDAIAFKWKDETAVTRLKEIEWSPSRTGLINPVAVFEPVELEGTTVSRASVHNISILKQLKLGEGDEIEVYKANMIIPQILRNHTESGSVEIPHTCPVCGTGTEIRAENGVETLICPNSSCSAKMIKSFTHFASRNALNIEGMSEATIEKFVEKGFIRTFADFFRLEEHGDEISCMEGFGKKSFANIKAACEKASVTAPARLLYAIGIPNIGTSNAGMISKHCKGAWDMMKSLSYDELVMIQGIGDVMASDYVEFFRDERNKALINELEDVLSFEDSEENSTEQIFEGKTFVITGSLETFENRNQLKELIESLGGKVAGSVSSRTDYLINNDSTSGSSKNKKAIELGVRIITEKEFLEMQNA